MTRLRKPSREYVEAFASEVNQIIESIRIVRRAPVGWSVYVTDRSSVADFFSDKPDGVWQRELVEVADTLGVSVDGTIVDVARRMRRDGV